jgi:hypothetical protein
MCRLDRLPQVVGALLSDIIVSASSSVLWSHSHCHCHCHCRVRGRGRGSSRTWSGALGRCGPAPTTVRSAAPLCLLHLGRAAEEKGSCGPSIRRKTQRRCVCVWVRYDYALCRCKVTRDWGTRAKRVEGSPSSRLGNEQQRLVKLQLSLLYHSSCSLHLTSPGQPPGHLVQCKTRKNGTRWHLKCNSPIHQSISVLICALHCTVGKERAL